MAYGGMFEIARKRAIVVDDDESICDALCSLLMQAGYDAVGVQTTEAAMAEIAKGVDFVALDGVMPEADPFKILAAAVAAGVKKICGMSSHEDLNQKMVKAGAHAKFQKPIHMSELRPFFMAA